SLAAFLCLAATQGIFWMFTYPMNVASNNWTVTPADFEVARRQWEYSHAVNAVLRKIALRETYCTAGFRRSLCRVWVNRGRGDRSRTIVYVRFAPKADKRVAAVLRLLCANRDLTRRSKMRRYSITSSAVASSLSGTVMPSIRAVSALMTSSNFDD